MKKMNPVVHFEMPYEDHERLIKFYTKVFGWEMHQLGKDMGDYITASTSETDEKGMIKKPGAINGGFFPKTDNRSILYPSFVVAVDDIVEAMNKVKNEGGKILGEPVEIPGIGKYVSIMDTEGNKLSLLQPIMR